MSSPQILIIDLGSQYTLVIGRTLRELGVRSVIFSPGKADAWLRRNRPAGIILSGGSASVYDKDAPQPPEQILHMGVPVLGICYGMQWLAENMGGKVVSRQGRREYGEARAIFHTHDPLDLLVQDLDYKEESAIWASHGDSVEILPLGFKEIARSKGGIVQGMSNYNMRMWGLQFHPEVTHTYRGKNILKRFLFDICIAKKDWNPVDVVAEIQRRIRAIVGGKRAIIGFSGGVDSTTLSAILSPILKKNLLAICIDTGGLRKNELLDIKENAEVAGVNLKIIKAARRFYEAIGSTVNAEVKRHRFQKPYAAILDEETNKFRADFVIQASIAPDMIESAAAGEATKIKTHHNTGLKLKVIQLHPLYDLFKYEVRELASQVGLPPFVVNRQPFPGPGLFVRVKGAPVTREKIAIARWADAEVVAILKRTGDYDKISQLVVGLECSRSSGVKGDGRVYGYTALVRPVLSSDFMTASTLYFSEEVWREIDRALTKHRMIVGAAYMGTTKPPATVEFE